MRLRSLKTQIFIFFSVSILAAILLLSALYFSSFSNVLTTEAVRTTDKAIQKSGRSLEQYISQLEELSRILESNPAVYDFFYAGTPEKTLKTEVEAILQNVVEIKSDVVSIVLVGRDGRLVSNEIDLPMELSKDMMKTPWYKNTLESNGMPLLTSARMQDFSMDKDTWVISSSREIKSKTGDNVGVMLIDLKYKLVENVLGDMDLGKTGYVFVINDGGQLVYHNDPLCFTDETKANALRNIASSDMSKVNDMIVTRYHLQNADWTLVALASLDSITMITQDFSRVIVFSSTLLLIISLLLSILFAQKVIRPLSDLEAVMTRVENGDFDVAMYISKTQEIGSLSRHFFNMLDRVKLLMVDIKNKERTLRETELFALQSQINPHFLYNSLETIIWMAEFQDSEKVIALTTALSKFFRLSLKTGSGIASLGDEIEHIRQYLYIQSFRYEDLIQYDIDVAEDCLDIKVPKLILQPIIENAIDHGLRKRKAKKGGHIAIKSLRVPELGDVIISITDNGEGFHCPKDYFLPTQEQINTPGSIELDIKKTDYEKRKSTGVGLKNVAMRVHLFYEGRHGLLINSSPEGTVVKVILKAPKE